MSEFLSVRITKEDHDKLKGHHEKTRIPMIHLLSEAISDLITKHHKKTKK